MSLIWPILQNAVQFPNRTAAIDDRRRYTYAEIAAAAMALAEKIDAATTAKHVGIMLPTSGAFPVALLAAWLAKRVAVPYNYLLSPDELTYVIRDSDADTVITSDDMLDALRQQQKRHDVIPDGVTALTLDGMDLADLPPLRWPPLPPDDELAVILYTSGTSGRPKGVMLTHGNLHTNVEAAIEHAGITDADTFLGVLPQFHSFGLTALTLLPLRIAATAVYTARFIPRRIVKLMQKHRPDLFLAVPSMYGALLSVKAATPDDFASIRLAVSGGEPLPHALARQYQDRFNLKLLEGYGLTETSPITNWSTPELTRPGSVGTSVPGVTEIIVGPDDRPLPPGEEGEVLIAGPNIMRGYYKLPEQTHAVFVDLPNHAPDTDTAPTRRFFRTGDIGKIDPQGFLYITGRKKEMLIIGGENVFPREIEEVLNQHESVRDSAVIGRPDPIRGEVPIAYVEPNDPDTFDPDQLRNDCRDQLAQYKVPREIHPVEQLPRNATGKILRRKLKDLAPTE